MQYIPSIGLEVHVQLDTRTKMFCACMTDLDSEPNTNICPVCLGYPGALPVMNEEAVRLTVMTGLMLGCEINPRSKFDRKNYFYPDMPKNYQISQYDSPLCIGGGLDIEAGGVSKYVRLVRIHLEEDVAKSSHTGGISRIDFNRAGHPLMEIVTEPDISSPDEAMVFLSRLRQILLYGGISKCNLEDANMRCDVNCSVRPEGREELGVKTELKNMNTFKGVFHALEHEIERQKALLASGGAVAQETRRWNAELCVTEVMRSKEEAHDYRYLPDPDLVPVCLAAEQVEGWRECLPELPEKRIKRMTNQYGIPEYDAKVLADDKAIADFFEVAAGVSGNPKAVSNWMMTEMLRCLADSDSGIDSIMFAPEDLARLVELVDKGVLNSNSAKEVFAVMFEKGVKPDAAVENMGLKQVSDVGELEKMVDEALNKHADSVDDYRKGKKAALQFLVGQVMRMSKGKANPKMVQEMLKGKLDPT